MALTDAFPSKTSGAAPAASSKGLSSIFPTFSQGAVTINEDQIAGQASTDAATAAKSVGGITKNIGSDLKDFGGNTLHDVLNALTAKGPETTSNIAGVGADGTVNDSAAGQGFAQVLNNFNTMGTSLRNAISTVKDNHASLLDKGLSVGQAGMDTLGGLFSVVTAPITVAQHIPGIGPVATGLNNIFNAIGTAGSDVAVKGVDALPISDETKEKIKPLVGQLGALAAQLVVGKGSDDIVEKTADKAHEIVSTAVNDAKVAQIANDAYPVINAKKIASEKVAARAERPMGSVYEDGTKPEPYTPQGQLPTIEADGSPAPSDGTPTIDITPPEEPGPDRAPNTYKDPADLPTIQMGAGARSELPTVQIGDTSKPYNGEYKLTPIEQARVDAAPTPEEKELTYHAITERNDAMQEPFQTDRQNPHAPQPVEMGAVKPPSENRPNSDGTPTSSRKPSGLALSTNAKAIADGLTDEYGDLPEYKSKTHQLSAVADYVENDHEDAVKVALGQKAAPHDFIPTVVYRAVELKARLEGDIDTIARLTSKENKLSGKVSSGAQLLGGLRIGADNSPTDIINDINKSREDYNNRTRGKKGGQEEASTVKDANKAIESEVIPKKDFNDFLGSITCNI